MIRTLALASAASLVLAAGCGDDDSADDGGSATSTGESELLLTLDADGDGGKKLQTAQVKCPGDAPELCDAVAGVSLDDIEPVSKDTACPEIYGGPDLLTVTGTIGGEEVRAEFTRENGCEIERFRVWEPVLTESFEGYKPGSAIAP